MDFKSLLEKLLGGEDTEQEALLALGEVAGKEELQSEYATQLRLKGLVSKLLTWAMGGTNPARRSALMICSRCADVDSFFATDLHKEGVLPKLVNVSCELWQPQRAEQSLEDVVCVYKTLQKVLFGKKENLGQMIADELFKYGYIARAAKIIDRVKVDYPPLIWAACSLIRTVSAKKSCRERLQDVGVIPRITEFVRNGECLERNIGTLCNLSLSEALHSALRDAGMFEAMQKAIGSANECDSALALVAIALVYASSEKPGGPAGKLLSSRDVSTTVASWLDATVRGDGRVYGTYCSRDLAAHGSKALSCSPALADSMCKAGVLDLLVELLQVHGGDDESVLYTCQALLNLSTMQFLQRSMIKAGVPEAIKPFAEHPDLRTSDAARGCLLQLGHLNDRAAEVANEALESLDSQQGCKYDVFLSHKRSDAKDFARALYNLLVLCGVPTFLDFEYREELQLEGGLEKLVSSCRNFVFVLTDNILESHWSMQELRAAVASRRNIILVVKEGSRWPNEEGQKTLPFPGAHLLSNLEPELKSVFGKKAIHHSDEYCASFIDMLMKKVTANKPPPSQAEAGPDPGTPHTTHPAALLQPPPNDASAPALMPHASGFSGSAYTPLEHPAAAAPPAPPFLDASRALLGGLGLQPAHPAHLFSALAHPQQLPAQLMPYPQQGAGAIELLSQLGQVERTLNSMVLDVRREMTQLTCDLMRTQADVQHQAQLRSELSSMVPDVRREISQLTSDLTRTRADVQQQAQLQSDMQGLIRAEVRSQVKCAQDEFKQQLATVQRQVAAVQQQSNARWQQLATVQRQVLHTHTQTQLQMQQQAGLAMCGQPPPLLWPSLGNRLMSAASRPGFTPLHAQPELLNTQPVHPVHAPAASSSPHPSSTPSASPEGYSGFSVMSHSGPSFAAAGSEGAAAAHNGNIESSHTRPLQPLQQQLLGR